MEENEIILALEECWLSEREVKTYLTWLKFSSASVSTISKECKEKRTTTFYVLQRLNSLWLATEEEQNWVKFYSMIWPRVLIRWWRTKYEKTSALLEKIIPSLEEKISREIRHKVPTLSVIESNKYYRIVSGGWRGSYLDLPKDITCRILPDTSEKVAKVLKTASKEKPYILSLGTGPGKRELFYRLPENAEDIIIECFDLLKEEPKNIKEERDNHKNICINYHTNYDVTCWADMKEIPKEFRKKTKILTMHGVFEYIKKEKLGLLLKNIRDYVEPDYFSVRLPYWFFSEQELKEKAWIVDFLVAMNTKKTLPTTEYKIFAEKWIGSKEFSEEELVLLSLPGEGYPSTYVDGLELAKFMSKAYEVVAYDAYCDKTRFKEERELPNSLVICFKRKE